MQLCYRGTKYQAQTKAVNTVKSKITARFLGQTYTLHQTSYQIPSQSDMYKYRGIVYQK
jgi:hypothetical protein